MRTVSVGETQAPTTQILFRRLGFWASFGSVIDLGAVGLPPLSQQPGAARDRAAIASDWNQVGSYLWQAMANEREAQRR